jgi:hypothetical protein
MVVLKVSLNFISPGVARPGDPGGVRGRQLDSLGQRPRWEAEECACGHADSISPAPSGLPLALRGLKAGIAGVQGQLNQELGPAPKRCQLWMQGEQQFKQILKIVSPRHRQALFLHKCFEVFLGTLLGAKADEIVHRRATGRLWANWLGPR